MGKLKKSVRGLVVVHPMTALGREMGLKEMTGFAAQTNFDPQPSPYGEGYSVFTPPHFTFSRVTIGPTNNFIHPWQFTNPSKLTSQTRWLKSNI